MPNFQKISNSLRINFQLRLKKRIPIVLGQLVTLHFDEVPRGRHVLNRDNAGMFLEFCCVANVCDFVAQFLLHETNEIVGLAARQGIGWIFLKKLLLRVFIGCAPANFLLNRD
jgi:hypothetical protein